MDITKALLELAPGAEWSLNADDYNQLEWLSQDIPKPTRAQVEAKIEELRAVEPMRLLRIHRDKLLAETDWITLKAYSQGVSVPEEWVTYQQALRDLPENTIDPANPVWPTKPS